MSDDAPPASADGSPIDGLRAAVGGAAGTADDALQGVDLYPIVKKEFVDTIRTRALLALALLYSIPFLFVPILNLYTPLGIDLEDPTAVLLWGMNSGIMAVLIPLTAIVLSYAAVSAERSSGSLKLLLSQPYSRRDVVLGKLVGRFVSAAALFLATVVVNLLVVLPEAGFSGVDWSNLGVLVGLSLFLAAVFVAVGVGASAASTTTRRSLAAAGGLWVGFFLVWNILAQGLVRLLVDHAGLEAVNASRVLNQQPIENSSYLEILLFLKVLNPTQAFKTLHLSLTGTAAHEARAALFGATLNTQGGAFVSRINQQATLSAFEGSLPIFLTDGAMVAILLAWIVVPAALGYVLFRDADL